MMTREEAINLIENLKGMIEYNQNNDYDTAFKLAIEALKEVERHNESFEWCTDCKEYDHKNHCCHRWTKRIRDTVEELKSRSSWHDLRKNPDDLPEWPTTDVIVCFIMPYGEKVYRYCWYSKEKRCFVDERVFHRKDKAIAWKEIEPFEPFEVEE